MQPVCTDGYFDTKKAQENRNAGGTRLHNAAPPQQRGRTCKAGTGCTPRAAYLDARQTCFGGRGHDVTRPLHTSAASRQSPDAPGRLKLPFMCSIITICITIDDSLLSERHRSPRHMSVRRANGSYLHFTALHQLNEVSKKDVSVPLAEPLRVVGHLEERHTERVSQRVVITQRGRG